MFSIFNLIFFYFLLCNLDSSTCSLSSRTYIYRLRRQTDCDGYQCRTSGECLNEDKYCDGHVDCSDGSDETNRCLQLSCPGFVFRCKYGACINKWLECDGKKDCKDGSDETSGKCKKPTIGSKCKDTQFECKSGQCISEDNKCDGAPDCTDQSDETAETCLKMRCPKYTFKCKYGACISVRGLCDGNRDCLDGSDENNDNCGNNPLVTPVVTSAPPIIPTPTTGGGNRPPPVTTPGSCELPAQIAEGQWSIWTMNNEKTFDYIPGDRVTPGTILNIKCRSGYKVGGSAAILFCAGGNWSPKVPTCVQTCPPLNASPPTFVTCTHKGAETDCNEAVSQTTAKYSCGQYHELSTTHSTLYCWDGQWDNSKPTCVPVCGEKNVKIKELIIGGEVVKRGTYPWTIALYREKGGNYSHICGGSLISQRVIVTAAHCVTTKDGVKQPTNIYRVAAGKYYNLYNDPKDTDAEFSEVQEISIAERYKGSTFKFEGDIAVLVTKEAFNYSQFIQRICVDWDHNSFYENRLLGTNGTVTGWGYTVRGDAPSEVLKEISLPYVDFASCYTAMPDDYKQYVLHDKICAGYLDKGIGVCEGDSGGGLAFLRLENNRYYLRGIVSVAPQVSGSCNENEYALYTKVSTYIDFIASIDAKYRN